MTNSLAITLALIVVGLIALDIMIYDAGYLLFLGRKFVDLITWVAFWR